MKISTNSNLGGVGLTARSEEIFVFNTMAYKTGKTIKLTNNPAL
jgi:hypothetical protein